MKKFGLTFKVDEEEGVKLIVTNCLISQRREEGTDEVWRRSKLDTGAF